MVHRGRGVKVNDKEEKQRIIEHTELNLKHHLNYEHDYVVHDLFISRRMPQRTQK